AAALCPRGARGRPPRIRECRTHGVAAAGRRAGPPSRRGVRPGRGAARRRPQPLCSRPGAAAPVKPEEPSSWRTAMTLTDTLTATLTDEKEAVLELVRKYHQAKNPPRGFEPGVTEIWPSGATLFEEDRVALVEAALDMRIAAGHSSRKFESPFARK